MSSLGSYFSPLLSILVFLPFSLFISLFFIHFLLRQCAIVNMEEERRKEGEKQRVRGKEREIKERGREMSKEREEERYKEVGKEGEKEEKVDRLIEG